MDKEKYRLELLVKSSPRILYNAISSPSGLSEWFCDDVNIRDDVFTFFWDGSEEKARLLSKRQNESVRFQWLDDEGEDYFFELRIVIDPLTKEVALMVTDFAEPDEMDEAKQLWESQVDTLKQVLGS